MDKQWASEAMGELSQRIPPVADNKTPKQLASEAAHWSNLGYTHAAVACHITCVNYYALHKDKANEAHALVQLGRGYDQLGNIDEAIDACEHGLAIAKEIGDRQIESMALVALGMAYGHLGYAQRTLDYGEQSLAIAREIGMRQSEQAAIECLGHAHLWLGELEDALRFYRQGLHVANEFGSIFEQAALLEYIGLAYRGLGDILRAIDCYTQSMSMLNNIDAIYSKGRLFAHLGDAYTFSQRLSEAEDALSYARIYFDFVHMYRGYTLLTYYRANLLRQQQRFEDAQQHYQHTIALFDDIQDRYSQAQCLMEYAHLLREHKQGQEALNIASTALTIYRERGTAEQVARVQEWMGE